ncbi:unnamed protein product [Caenorhabditis angaria]|uniref:lysozyme n=1 Tax=Caenorhabditis angaria TaxID=860376 RepID=A0A9P1N0Y2_9PELO|nr:unnamed protein product [Caenorhabditis angaria]
MFYIFLQSIFIIQIACVINEIPNSFCLQSICELETNCGLNLTNSCSYDSQNRKVCGYFRLSEYMYKNCYFVGFNPETESIRDAFHRCANNYTCASECVKNVPNIAKHKCNGISKCQKIAMAHFEGRGPYGCTEKSPERMGYWSKVEKLSMEFSRHFMVLRQFFE